MSETITVLACLVAFGIVGLCFWLVVRLASRESGKTDAPSGVARPLIQALFALILALIILLCAITGFDPRDLIEFVTASGS